MANRSKQSLNEFLDYLADKGLAPKSTISARKASVNKVLGVLTDDEVQDVSELDMDEVAVRFSNLEGKNYTPDSLKTYVSRARVAIDDFQRYVESPMTFKAKANNAGPKPKSSADSVSGAQLHQKSGNSDAPSKPARNFGPAVLPIPIRADLTVEVSGMPFDLTEAEANKIANVIKAMAM